VSSICVRFEATLLSDTALSSQASALRRFASFFFFLAGAQPLQDFLITALAMRGSPYIRILFFKKGDLPPRLSRYDVL